MAVSLLLTLKPMVRPKLTLNLMIFTTMTQLYPIDLELHDFNCTRAPLESEQADIL